MNENKTEPTFLDYFGFTLALEEGKKTDTIIPAWQCTNDDKKAEFRAKALDSIRTATRMGLFLSEEGANKMLRDVPQVRSEFERWKAHEEKLATDRENGNPQAFFFHT